MFAPVRKSCSTVATSAGTSAAMPRVDVARALGEAIALAGAMNSTTRPIKHILVAHDFQETADAALDYAMNLAKGLGSQVTVLHAYEVPSMGAPEVLVMATDWTKQFGVVAGEALEKTVSRIRGKGVEVRSELRRGKAWREVDSFAKEQQVDLIVVGSHGRHGLPRALLGSVAEKIVRTAPCPVLVVHGAKPTV